MANNPIEESGEFNPYQPTDHASQDAITHLPGLLETIAKLAFWQRIAAGGLLFFSGVLAAYTILIYVVNGGGFDLSDIVGLVIFFAFFVFFVILPMVYLWWASRAAYRYFGTGTMPDQTRFILAQLRFWRSTTIAGLLFVVLMFLFVVLTVFSIG